MTRLLMFRLTQMPTVMPIVPISTPAPTTLLFMTLMRMPMPMTCGVDVGDGADARAHADADAYVVANEVVANVDDGDDVDVFVDALLRIRMVTRVRPRPMLLQSIMLMATLIMRTLVLMLILKWLPTRLLW